MTSQNEKYDQKYKKHDLNQEPNRMSYKAQSDIEVNENHIWKTRKNKREIPMGTKNTRYEEFVENIWDYMESERHWEANWESAQ